MSSTKFSVLTKGYAEQSRMTDTELVEYYSQLLTNLGGDE